MRALSRPKQQPRRAACEPRQRASTLLRIRRAQRHGERQRARLAIAGALALLLAIPASARGEVPPSTEGRMVDLRSGEPAPWDGALVDAARARVLLERRRAAELAAEEAIARTTTCAGELATCQAGGGEGWRPATVAALVAAALALGVVGGVYLGVQAGR